MRQQANDPMEGVEEGDGQAPCSLQRGGSLRKGLRTTITTIPEAKAASQVDQDFSSVVSSMTTNRLNITSNPASPSQPGTPLSQTKGSEFVPPTRPSSTPFNHPEHRHLKTCYVEPFGMDYGPLHEGTSAATLMQDAPVLSKATHFLDLPIEVHEGILDHILGYRVSATSSSSMSISCVTKKWSSVLRHSRRRELTELSLVSRTWRELVQQRLYRHIKFKATLDFMDEAMMHFQQRQHLRGYVKHLEVWFPVFQPTYGPASSSSSLTLPTVTNEGLTNATYTLPANNCTLEEVFKFVDSVLPEARVLTLEGGERRKAPKVVHFHGHDPELPMIKALPVLHSIRTLVTRGQWNLLRMNSDYVNVLQAMPNLVEWQSSYSKPKAKSYVTMSEFLPFLPPTIASFNLCLESDYRKEGIIPAFYSKVLQKTHLCPRMAKTLSTLEHFAYTGRICHKFFDSASTAADGRPTRLRSIDLTVKNCCRHHGTFHDSGCGIQDMGFIDAFEMLVLAGIRSLQRFTEVEYLRIRFVDLDSVLPPLNPYFLYHKNMCSGLWSDDIVHEMTRVRPNAAFPDLSDSFGTIGFTKDGRMTVTPEWPRTKITSLKASNYRAIANRITIQ